MSGRNLAQFLLQTAHSISYDNRSLPTDFAEEPEKWWNAVLPLMVNEGLPKVGKGEHPLALRYEKQLKEKGIPDWMPAEL